jgi:hypothetical protein
VTKAKIQRKYLPLIALVVTSVAMIISAMSTQGVERQTLGTIVNKTSLFKFNPRAKVDNPSTAAKVHSIKNKIYVANSGSNTVSLNTSNALNKSTFLDYKETDRKMSFDTMLRYHLDAKHSYIVDEQIIISFTLENISNKDLWILTWYTPLEGLKGNIFRVICDGQEMPYEGIMAKRGDPNRDDYVQIPSKASVSSNVDLSKAYKLLPCNECRVGFKAKIFDISDILNSIPKGQDQHQPIDIQGNDITFSIVRP